jgi:hypothetical protein
MSMLVAMAVLLPMLVPVSVSMLLVPNATMFHHRYSQVDHPQLCCRSMYVHPKLLSESVPCWDPWRFRLQAVSRSIAPPPRTWLCCILRVGVAVVGAVVVGAVVVGVVVVGA